MRLFMADILLHRVRLFLCGKRSGASGTQPTGSLRAEREGASGTHPTDSAPRTHSVWSPYPWGSPKEDLAAARKLIEECGYHRRDEELADAEAAMEESEE